MRSIDRPYGLVFLALQMYFNGKLASNYIMFTQVFEDLRVALAGLADPAAYNFSSVGDIIIDLFLIHWRFKFNSCYDSLIILYRLEGK